MVMSQRLRAWLHALLAAALFAAALAVLHHELREVHYRDLLQAVASLPKVRLLWAMVLCIASYAVLTGYDQLAFLYVKKTIGRWRVAVAAFVGVAIANNAGLALLSGASVRYRFYTRWGIGAGDLSRVVLFCSSAYWLGLLALGGWSLTFHPHPAIERYGVGALGRGAGVALLAVTAAYLAAAAIHLPPLRVRSLELAIPSFRLALAQLGLSMLDWVLATAVLYALLPAGAPSFGVLLGAFLAAQLIGMMSQVPGGVGVFEGVMLVELAQFYRTEQILSALVLYRVIYYLLPLCAGLAILIGDEISVHRHRLARIGAMFGNATLLIAPKVLAVFTFLAGVVLLFSGATPAQPGRLAALARFLPLGVFEASHFLGSVVGVALLVVAQGVARRLDVAYYAAILLLSLGIGFSLLKAGDWEEAVLLSLLLLAFLPSRDDFERRASFFEVGLAPGWTLAALVAVAASIWLGLFAFRHVEYRSELWWRFALDHDAPRFLRASVGATVTLFAVGVARLMQPVAPRLPAPTSAELDGVERAIDAQVETYPYLVFLGDKSVLWNESRDAFLMYGAQGRSWVALGDPVGPPEAAPDLIRAFLERVDDYAGVPVFYQVRGDRLHSYADFGLDRGEAGRGGARSARDVLDRRRRAPWSAHGAPPPRARGRRVPGGAGRGRARDPARAARGVGRLARAQVREREGLLARLLRRGLSAPLSGRHHRGGRPHSSLRQPVARPRSRGAVGRPDAIPAHGAEGRDGRACSVSSCCGASERATSGSRSASLRCRDCRVDRWLRPGHASDVWCSAMARRSTTSRASAPTRTSSTRSGSRATWPTPACCSCRGCSRTSRLWSLAACAASSGDADFNAPLRGRSRRSTPTRRTTCSGGSPNRSSTGPPHCPRPPGCWRAIAPDTAARGCSRCG